MSWLNYSGKHYLGIVSLKEAPFCPNFQTVSSKVSRKHYEKRVTLCRRLKFPCRHSLDWIYRHTHSRLNGSTHNVTQSRVSSPRARRRAVKITSRNRCDMQRQRAAAACGLILPQQRPTSWDDDDRICYWWIRAVQESSKRNRGLYAELLNALVDLSVSASQDVQKLAAS